jgi:hypothetical protein
MTARQATTVTEERTLDVELPARMERPPRIDGPVVGRIVRFDALGVAVDYNGNPEGSPVPARSVVGTAQLGIDREVVLMFEDSDPLRPLIMGVLQPVGLPVQAEVDGERLVLSARREIVLRCGEASITLTEAGKVLIRGNYVLSRSSGANRIKGAAVEIN